MKRYFRSFWDYLIYFEWKLQKHKKLVLILAALGLVLPVLVNIFAPRNWGAYKNASFVIPFVMILLGIIKRALSVYGRQNISFESSKKVISLSENVLPSELEESRGFVTVKKDNGGTGAFVYSREFNKSFVANRAWDPELECHDRSSRYSAVIANVRSQATENRIAVLGSLFGSLRLGKKTLINESKVGLMTDLKPNTETVEVYKTDYFSDMCLITNGMKNIVSKSDGQITVISPAIPKRMPYEAVDKECTQVRLYDFERTTPAISLHMGVEILAVSKDFLFRIPIQSHHVQYATGERAPFASGSMDWEDVLGVSTLKAAVIKAATRELQEEWGGDGNPPQIKSIQVIGYFRACHRGGKPQFVCFAKLDNDDSNIFPDTSENYKGNDDPKTVYNLEQLVAELNRQISEEFHNPDSVALQGALHCLRDFCLDHPENAKKILSA